MEKNNWKGDGKKEREREAVGKEKVQSVVQFVHFTQMPGGWGEWE